MILGIETATMVCGVGLVEGDQLVAEYRLRRGLSHAEVLPDAVRRMMEDAGVDEGQVEGIAVSSGPGSFTGLRIGMGFAKGLALGWGKPLLTVPTMEGMTAVLPPVAGWACVLLRARKNEAYRGLYRWSDSAWESASEIRVLSEEKMWEDLPDAPIVFLGEGAESRRESIRAAFPEARWAGSALSHPSGYGVARAGQILLWEGKTTDPERAVPMYVKRFQGVA